MNKNLSNNLFCNKHFTDLKSPSLNSMQSDCSYHQAYTPHRQKNTKGLNYCCLLIVFTLKKKKNPNHSHLESEVKLQDDRQDR